MERCPTKGFDDSNKSDVNCLMEQSQKTVGWANYRMQTLTYILGASLKEVLGRGGG